LLRCAYGDDADAAGLEAGLAVAARALNEGDLGRAMIATLRLRLADLNWNAAVRLAQVDDALAKYDPDEPRDARGRWTRGDGSAEGDVSRPMRSRLLVPLLPDDQAKPGSTESERSWSDEITFEGRQRLPVQDCEPPGIGDNMPPPEAEPVPEAEPNLPTLRVPQGWDRPAYTVNGLHYPATRQPLLRDGTPWPTLTPDIVRSLLAPIGRGIPNLVAFVPRDGIGPILLGSTATSDYEQPSGYDTVTFYGTPQVTYSGGSETGHAEDGINEALDLARSNQFSKFYFNRSFSVITNRMVQSRIRPDVVGVVRPELNLREIYHPYESLSPGQRREYREQDFPKDPSIKPLDARYYKIYKYLRSPYFIYIGADAPCS
jgi:hypothetical protein